MTAEDKEVFFASGRQHVELVLSSLRKHVDASLSPRRILDFGCGVGRVVIPFAQIAAEVVGMDVSPSMLAEARSNCAAGGTTNVTLLRSDDTLSTLEGTFDLVHSCIVLQHIEVARGTALFAQLVRRIHPGGVGAIHVTFGWTIYAATYGQPVAPPPPPPPTKAQLLKKWIRGWLLPERESSPPTPAQPESDPEMQMNYYNLSELMFVLQRAGVQQVHTEMTDHGGALGAFLFFRIPPELTPADG